MPVSLDPEAKRWLDKYARSHNVSAASVVREALDVYRTRAAHQDISLRHLLEATHGTWKGREKPLEYQRRLRREWDHRS